MKVLEINATYGYGSTGLIIKDIGRLLEAEGHEVRFAYQMGDCDTNVGYRIGNPIDWKLHAVITRLTGRQGWGSHLATWRLLRYLDREKPDIVHLHNLHANYINLPMLLGYLANHDIATVITLHDCWFFTGKCCHFMLANCSHWKTGCGACMKQKEAPASLFVDSSASVAAAKRELFNRISNLTVVCCSQWISNIAEQSYVLQGHRIEQIYNGVDVHIFQPRNRAECKKHLHISADFVILGTANKWLEEKNQAVLSLVIFSLSENDELVLIGCTEAQKKQIEQLPKGRGHIKAVDFIQDRQLLSEYYNAADVFVNLTFEDTLPTVNMEALACGTPVITYDSCGSPELVCDGKTGYIIPQLDGQALCEAIGKIKNNEISRDQCLEYSIENFNKDECYKEYISLFHDILKKKRLSEENYGLLHSVFHSCLCI